MSTYRESYYNIKKMYDSRLIIFNTLNGNFVQFDSDLAGKACEQLNGTQCIRDQGVFDELVKFGFIIPQETDERSILERLKDSVINNHEQLNLIIFPTEKCNFRCKYCYENFEKKAMSPEVQESLINFVKSNIKNYRRINVDWFGGEPLLNMDIIENLSKKLIEICTRNRVMYASEITTNGYFLTPENVEILKRCRVYKFHVTLDGPEEIHNRQRVLYGGGKTWQVIADNMRYIRDNLKSGLIQVSIRTNLTRYVYDCYKEYMGFLKEEFGQDKRFVYLFRNAEDWGNMQQEDIKKVFCNEEQYMEVLIESLKNNFFNIGTRMCLVPGGLLCYAWKKNTITVRSDGIVGKCTLNLYEKMNQIANIDSYEPGSHPGFWDASEKGTPGKCCNCKKYPVCLKVNCNMATNTEVECEYDMKYLEDILPYLCKPEYGCKLISRKDLI